MKSPFWFRSLNPVAIVLLPLAFVYFLLSKFVFISRMFWRKTSKTPVICVGGILAGGVGKTPIVREIARYLNAPVVMRGYKGRGRISGRPVGPGDSSFDIGDEAKMLSVSGLEVYVGNRSINIDAINYAPDIKVPAIIMDDGFQNPGIKKDISIVVFDESVCVGNGLLLPAGPMRETLGAGIKRADAVVICHGAGGGGKCMRVARVAKRLKKPVFFIKKEADTAGFFGKYVAFAGIGYPDKFFEVLRGIPSVRVVQKIPFGDHHLYTKKDIIRLFQAAKRYDARLICTEKDWVKLPRNIQAKVRFVPLKIHVQPNFYQWLEKKLEAKNGNG